MAWALVSEQLGGLTCLETGNMGGASLAAAVSRGRTLAGCRAQAWSLAGCRARHWRSVPRQADVLETDFGGDKRAGIRRLFGLENEFRSTADTWSRFSAEHEEFGGPGSTKHAVRSLPFSALFAPKTER